MNSSAQSLLTHQLHDTAIIARVGLERRHHGLFSLSLELHERWRAARAGARRTRATVDFEHRSHWAFASDAQSANAHRWAVWEDPFVQDAVHVRWNLR